jgi:hypothetical protein
MMMDQKFNTAGTTAMDFIMIAGYCSAKVCRSDHCFHRRQSFNIKNVLDALLVLKED